MNNPNKESFVIILNRGLRTFYLHEDGLNLTWHACAAKVFYDTEEAVEAIKNLRRDTKLHNIRYIKNENLKSF